MLVLTNLDGREAHRALAQRFRAAARFVVFGAAELGSSLDRHPPLRAAMPSVLGLRDLNPLIRLDARSRSSLDLVSAQERFLSSCGTYGVLLALSQQGGVAGERSLPLLISDRDWDTLGDRMTGLLRELEDQDVARVLFALADALGGELEPVRRSEAESLTHYVLGATRRSWQKQARALPVFLVEAWYAANARLGRREERPPIARTWTELHPSRSLLAADLSPTDLQALDDWLALAQVLSGHDRELRRRLGFYEHDQQLLAHLTVELGEVADPELRALAESMLRRIRSLSPMYRGLAGTTLARLQHKPTDERWWVPQDIDTPPSTEPVTHERIGFTREDIHRVLDDL